METTRRVLVIGAGVSGLACAFDLARAGREVLLLEAKDRAGGVVGTLEADGFRFETGPNTIPAGSEHFRRLCGDLGIADRLIASRPEAKLRYLLHAGRLRPLPAGPVSFLTTPLLSPRGKLGVLGEPFRRLRPTGDEEEEPSLDDFLRERIGREATHRLAGAFVRGVYAAEIQELGARSAFPRVWRLANAHGGLLRGALAGGRSRIDRAVLPGPKTARMDLLSFPTGLRELPDALARRLGGRLRVRTPVHRLRRREGGWTAVLESGDQIEGAAVVLAVPAPAAHRLLATAAPPESAIEALATIDHARITVTHLGLRAEPGPVVPPGFGFLVPPGEGSGPDPGGLLGSLFVSNLFPGRAPPGTAAVTGIYRTREVEELDGSSLADRAARDLAAALGSRSRFEIEVARSQRWTDVIPRYGVGHARRMKEVEQALSGALPGISLAGGYLAGVSVEDCVARGRAVAEALLRREET